MSTFPEKSDETVDGAAIAAAIIRRLPAAEAIRVMEAMESQDSVVVERVETVLFSGAGFMDLPAKELRAALAQASPTDIALCMRAAGKEERAHLLSHLPQPKVEGVKAALTTDPSTPMISSDLGGSASPVQVLARRAKRRLFLLSQAGERAAESARRSGRYA
jgi:flagellar motor switch protein FliG